LVTGLSAYIEARERAPAPSPEHVWVGWPGSTVAAQFRAELKREAQARFQSHPVFLSEEEMEQFYLGFCNATIWPLFHYFPSYAVYQPKFWEQYKRVNEVFCETLLDIVRQDDLVWIHDYHLMLLPRLLQARAPHLSVGFFLHIPFPSFEVFRLLPGKWRRGILEGLLGADLLGFHTHEYVQHFLQSVLRILGYEHNMGQILTPDGIVKADSFPMGIDFEKFSIALNDPDVRREEDDLKNTFSQVKVVLSVDRLDYSKGILNRLEGFEIFLETSPQYHGRVVLLMVVVPSRIGVYQYDLMKRQIEELVGKINGRFGRIDWTPVVYQYRHVPFQSLVALYSVSDVCLVTPLRDGMNLVAKEYVATRKDGAGILILSEMAGAAKELAEAIIINPNNREEIAEALKDALETPVEEQRRRNQIMQRRLRRYNVNRWAEDFMRALVAIKDEQKRLQTRLVTPETRDELVGSFAGARRRLLLLDYDGTLVAYAAEPKMAGPTDLVLSLLGELASNAANQVVLISGRDRNTLETWFGRLPVSLVAEHGVWIREQNEDWRMTKPLSNDWKPQILALLEMYADRLPGSFIEEKEFSYVWHYRKADPELASLRAKELVDDLVHFTASIDVQVIQGNKVVEVQNSGVNKGAAALHFLSKDRFEFVLAVGDDWTDEDLFKAVPEMAYSIRVGMAQSYARFNLPGPTDVLELLHELGRSAKE
ncbi:MAG: bifunctional alpha,alpha-trehalose-phosphate synthase (UDP-forming)/trehalose-phosphatase, partial [Deltaproteobacteria bacterium]|nr:bifunctional alpha,alpha-trehalose-phosphate synthase (UDP-forming)/trehalose-phosphatase [Deltaproteobacteria bacterium]